VWFRGKDLRVSDHGPLAWAAAAGEVVPLFVVDPYFFAPKRAQQLPHRAQFLVESLHGLADELARRGSQLLVVRGRSVDVVPRLVDALRIDHVVAQRWVEPFARERDRRVTAALGPRFELFEGETLIPPGTLRTQGGKPYAVYSQFARAFHREAQIGAPIPAPRTLPPVPPDVLAAVASEPLPTLSELGLTHNDALQRGGERAANQRLRAFRLDGAARYAAERDRMDLAGTSRLSADLKFGTLSVRQVWSEIERAHGKTEPGQKFLSELLWREFAHSTLWDRPELLREPFRPGFVGFPWLTPEQAPALWQAWTEGRTGYPVVDAAARQLLTEGYVHNRARMIAASFLTKHLLITYRAGEAHYLKYLTDGDWAQNNAGWQWSAGCGCDAQPYFRVFNPTLQGTRFDPEGDYVRRYVPELARMPSKHIHAPSEAPEGVLSQAGVTLGRDYPRPVVDHATARERFLALAKEHLKGDAA
ncbi:MAG: deoxyribodipyrimidine photo-lyase, partial [Polyangiales bacterium]